VRAFYRRKPSKLGGAIAMVLLYASMGAVAGFGATGSHDPFSFASSCTASPSSCSA